MSIKSTALWLIPALCLVALFSFHTITEPDMGYHLAGARWIVDNKSWPDTDPFTYTVSDHEYIDMHWLYQLGALAVWTVGGSFFYVLIHTILVLLAFALSIWLALQTRASPWLIALLVLLGAVASEHRFSVRPEVVSWALMMITILLLESGVKNQFQKRLYLLPLIMVLWVNIQGIFIVGLAVIACYCLEDLIVKRRFQKNLWFSAVAAFLATFINPYGWNGALFPLTLSSRLGGSNRFASSIGEFLSPWALDFPSFEAGTHLMLAAYYVLTVLVPLVLVFTWKKQPLRYWLLTIIFGVLAAQAIRNIPLYFLVTLPIIANGMVGLKRCTKTAGIGKVITGLLTLVLLLSAVNGNWHRWTQKLWEPGYKVTNRFLPVGAADYLVSNDIQGRILNELRHGGYLIWTWQQLVFIDGRLEVIQQEFFKEYQRAKQMRNPWSLVKKYQIEIAVFSHNKIPAWFHAFYHNALWKMVYFDSENVVFLHRDFRTDLLAIEIGDKAPDTAMTLTEFPVSHSYVKSFLFGYPTDWRPFYQQAKALKLMNRPDLAEPLLIQGLNAAQGIHADSWYELGHLAAKRGDVETAEKYFDAAIVLEPDHHRALLDRDRLRLMGADK